MRYDKTVYFVKLGEKTYDSSTGNYTRHPSDRTAVSASVMDTRAETMKLLYGDVRKGALTIQLQNHYLDPYDRIEVDGVQYQVDYARRLPVKHVFFVSEAM